ncbi:MAG: hypothetical protein ACLU4J_24065 [Butyricimonas paravirosa]
MNKNVFWSVNLSGAHNSNKITKISNAMQKRNDDVKQKAYEENTTTPLLLYEEGNSVTSIYAVRSLGIDPSNGREMFLTKTGVKTYTWNTNDQVKVGIPSGSGRCAGNVGYLEEFLFQCKLQIFVRGADL